MPVQILQHIKDALGNLDPDETRRHAERPMRLFLYANHEEAYRHMEDFFVPPNLSNAKRAELRGIVHRASEGFLPSESHDLEIYFEDSPESLLTPTRQVFAFFPDDPERTIREVLSYRPDLAIPLALHVFPFREEVSKRLVKKVARENPLFSLSTPIPHTPPFIFLPCPHAPFASTT